MRSHSLDLIGRLCNLRKGGGSDVHVALLASGFRAFDLLRALKYSDAEAEAVAN